MIAKGRIQKGLGNLNTTPSYDITTEWADGAYHTLVTAHCIECGEAAIVHWNTGGNHPDFVAKKFRGMGWHFDPYKPRKCVCPECVAGSHKFDEAAAEAARRSDAGLPMPVPVDNTTSEEPDMAKSNSYTPATVPATDTAVLRAVIAHSDANDAVGRTLTTHEKAKVRAILDSHFDDTICRYIDNYDDQRVGNETNLPWKLVADYRELAYGPLKADPAAEAVKAEALALRDEFLIISKAAEDLRASIQRIEGRLVNVEAKARKL